MPKNKWVCLPSISHSTARLASSALDSFTKTRDLKRSRYKLFCAAVAYTSCTSGSWAIMKFERLANIKHKQNHNAIEAPKERDFDTYYYISQRRCFKCMGYSAAPNDLMWWTIILQDSALTAFAWDWGKSREPQTFTVNHQPSRYKKNTLTKKVAGFLPNGNELPDYTRSHSRRQ